MRRCGADSRQQWHASPRTTRCCVIVMRRGRERLRRGRRHRGVPQRARDGGRCAALPRGPGAGALNDPHCGADGGGDPQRLRGRRAGDRQLLRYPHRRRVGASARDQPAGLLDASGRWPDFALVGPAVWCWRSCSRGPHPRMPREALTKGLLIALSVDDEQSVRGGRGRSGAHPRRRAPLVSMLAQAVGAPADHRRAAERDEKRRAFDFLATGDSPRGPPPRDSEAKRAPGDPVS